MLRVAGQARRVCTRAQVTDSKFHLDSSKTLHAIHNTLTYRLVSWESLLHKLVNMSLMGMVILLQYVQTLVGRFDWFDWRRATWLSWHTSTAVHCHAELKVRQ